MTADEMFKKLGYEKSNLSNENWINYYKQHYDDKYGFEFDLLNKEIYPLFYTNGKPTDDQMNITLDELKAINKKVEELRW